MYAVVDWGADGLECLNTKKLVLASEKEQVEGASCSMQGMHPITKRPCIYNGEILKIVGSKKEGEEEISTMTAPKQALTNGDLGPRVRKPSNKLVEATEIKKRKMEKSDKPLNMSVDNAKNEEKDKAKNKEEKDKAKNKEEKDKAKNKEDKTKNKKEKDKAKNKEDNDKDSHTEKRKTEKNEKPKETENINPNTEKIIEKILSKRNESERTDQSSSPEFPPLGSPTANITSWLGYLNSPIECESDPQFSMLPGASSWMEPKSPMHTPTCSCQGALNLLGERVSFLEGEVNKIKKKLKKDKTEYAMINNANTASTSINTTGSEAGFKSENQWELMVDSIHDQKRCVERLATAMFSEQELANSSVLGYKCNATYDSRPPLSPSRREVLEDICMKKFPVIKLSAIRKDLTCLLKKKRTVVSAIKMSRKR